VEYTGSSNSVEVNGITINALAVTGDGDDNAITITTAVDTQGIYDKIKDFLTEYNSIINEMCKLYNADSSSGYDPLTDDEKDAMSDSEVEKWETKIKDALLRHDSTLNSVMTSMTNAMAKSIKIDGKSYSLSSFGISTLGYFNSAENENYAYHIDGDEDDSNTSGKTDKLMAAISSDPDKVTSFFQQLASNLYDAIGSKMKSTTLSSIYTIYNDKQMSTQYSEYTDLISEWETRISDKEEYYYNKFSTMESSLATLNNTQSSLSSYFG
jgi:flagellar hook-associated protein 2